MKVVDADTLFAAFEQAAWHDNRDRDEVAEELLLKNVFTIDIGSENLVKAINRQVPQKPKKYVAYDGIVGKGCPACGRNEILYAGQRFCSIRGQAIDWGGSQNGKRN